ncbi:MAG: hypothetical protein ACK41Z_02380 [Sediminibacterium sp.]
MIKINNCNYPKNIFSVIVILIVFIGCKKSTEDNNNSIPTNPNSNTSSFTFTNPGFPQKPIRVFYHIPANGDKKTMPILLLLHGDQRNASDYRDGSISLANNKQFMVFAPEFSEASFPDVNYAIGNVYSDGNNPSTASIQPEAQWTYSYIEPLFDYIKQFTGSTKSSYKIFGFSAGGQFVHRFVMFKPSARYDTAIAASSGWYTVPNPTIAYPNFPYGIANSPLANTTPSSYFSRKLIITIGQLDNNNNDAAIRHNTQSDAQGLNRLDRSLYFIQQSQAYSTSLSTTFNWEYKVVNNAGHDSQLMLQAAINQLFQ